MSVPVDWKARAECEAAALIYGSLGSEMPRNRDVLLAVVATAWLQGNIFGTHKTLADHEQAFEELRYWVRVEQ